MEIAGNKWFWDEDDLQYFRREHVCIQLPAGEEITKRGINLLDRMLAAINIKPNEKRFIYCSDETESKPEHCTLYLIFTSGKVQEPELKIEEGSDKKIIRLPSLETIADDQNLKRKIWNILKD